MPQYRPARRIVAVAVAAAVFFVATSTDLRGPQTARGFEVLGRETNCRQSLPENRVVLLDCRPGFETGHDTVTIYLRGSTSDPTSDAVWLFRVGGGRVALIIDFHRDGTRAIADLYDDRDGDHSVAYVLLDGIPQPLESQHPTVSVTSLDGAWEDGQRTSFNLDISVDGSARATFGAGLGETPAYSHLQHDGRADYLIHVRDEDRDGKPDHEWRQFYPPFPESPALSEHYRTEIASNPEDDEVPVTDSFLWPHLALEARSIRHYVKDYGASPPPIQVDWSRAQVVQVSELVASRGNPGSFFIYSINRVREGFTTATNFENPFAFYDFAGADDGWPDTSIRFLAVLPGETDDVPNIDPINIVMYTWDQRHSHNWNYSLNLVGQQHVETTIQFDGFSVKAIPPQELPGWVAEQKWNAATFVEVNKPYWTSEHVYEYTPQERSSVLPYRYLMGLVEDPPTEAFEQIAEGFRGEYTFELDGPARLYVNPVDRRLHLAGATSGVWNMGRGREMRYANLGGPYVNHWIARDARGGAEQLYWAADQLIYASPREVLIGQMPSIHGPQLMPPPRNRAEWAGLSKLMDANAPSFAAGDLRAMFADIATTVRRLPGAAITGFRLTDDGFRFIFSPAPPLGITESDFLGGAGQFVVRYEAGTGYAWRPATPIALEVSPVTVIGDPPRASTGSTLSLAIRNEGDRDARGIRVSVLTGRPGEPLGEIGTVEVDVAGMEASEVQFAWTPPAAGDWLVRAKVDRMQELGPETVLNVADLPDGPDVAMRVEGLSPAAPVLALLLLVGAARIAGDILARDAGWPPNARRSRRQTKPKDA